MADHNFHLFLFYFPFTTLIFNQLNFVQPFRWLQILGWQEFYHNSAVSQQTANPTKQAIFTFEVLFKQEKYVHQRVQRDS